MHVTSSYWKTPQNSNSNITQPVLNLKSLKTSIWTQGNKQRHILKETVLKFHIADLICQKWTEQLIWQKKKLKYLFNVKEGCSNGLIH